MDTTEAKYRHSRKTKRLIFLTLIVLFSGFWLFGEKIYLSFTTNGYQAVFLTNGQVYFGRLSASGKWLHLSDIHYLQTSQALQQTDNGVVGDPNQNIQLVKLGKELHGPTDSMYIERDKVLFWENLKDDGKVVEAINKSKAK